MKQTIKSVVLAASLSVISMSAFALDSTSIDIAGVNVTPKGSALPTCGGYPIGFRTGYGWNGSYYYFYECLGDGTWQFKVDNAI